MATIGFKTGDDYALKLAALSNRSKEIVKKAIYPAAKIVADKVKSNIEGLPTDNDRFLSGKDKFVGLPEPQKKDLIDSFGITPIKLGSDGYWTAKLGFDGYGSRPTAKYPQGVPNQLLARAVESGSSVRQKIPFVRPAVNATKKEALEAMKNAADEEIKKSMKG